jgi:hypothetical protein
LKDDRQRDQGDGKIGTDRGGQERNKKTVKNKGKDSGERDRSDGERDEG